MPAIENSMQMSDLWLKFYAPLRADYSGDRHESRSSRQYSPSMSRRDTNGEGRSYNTKENLSLALKVQPGDDHFIAPPFDLLASLYLDGRHKPERRVIVYLDPAHDDFPWPDGKVRFKARWVRGEDGSVEEHAWVFKDVGIETVFDKLMIAESHNHAPSANQVDEDAMIAAINATGIGCEGDIKNEEKSSVGQIVVVVERIVLGAKWKEENYCPKHRNVQDDDIKMEDLGTGITHTTK